MKQFKLQYSCLIKAPREEVCAFHTDTRNLPRITPPSIAVAIVSKHEDEVVLDIKRLGITTCWVMRLEINCPNSITDIMLKGPFSYFKHERHFETKGDETQMNESITFSSPVPFLESLFAWFIQKDMDAMFAYRHRMTQAYFLEKTSHSI